MRTLHSTLLVGPSDWDPVRLPKDEFLARIEAIWLRIPDCSGAIVYGDAHNHAELAYLTHVVPKLGPVLALMPKGGEPMLLVADGPNMFPSVARMTWIGTLGPLGEAALSEWQRALPRGRIALFGGEHMRPGLNATVSKTVAPIESTPVLHALMRRKRAREIALVREACAMLQTATQALADAVRARASVTTAVLDAERAANRAGAQDVRTLFSLDGGHTLGPFESPLDLTVDPLQAYIAVRHLGYWAEGFAMFGSERHAVLDHAAHALTEMVAMAHAGARCADLKGHAKAAIAPYGPHPLTAESCGNAIGLALEEAPRIASTDEAVLDDGALYTLRVGATDGKGGHAIVSAMVAVAEQANEVLWRSP